MSSSTRRIQQIATDDLSNLNPGQIGYTTVDDDVMGKRVFGGMNDLGEVSVFIEKDQNARLKNTTLTSVSVSGAPQSPLNIVSNIDRIDGYDTTMSSVILSATHAVGYNGNFEPGVAGLLYRVKSFVVDFPEVGITGIGSGAVQMTMGSADTSSNQYTKKSTISMTQNNVLINAYDGQAIEDVIATTSTFASLFLVYDSRNSTFGETAPMSWWNIGTVSNSDLVFRPQYGGYGEVGVFRLTSGGNMVLTDKQGYEPYLSAGPNGMLYRNSDNSSMTITSGGRFTLHSIDELDPLYASMDVSSSASTFMTMVDHSSVSITSGAQINFNTNGYPASPSIHGSGPVLTMESPHYNASLEMRQALTYRVGDLSANTEFYCSPSTGVMIFSKQDGFGNYNLLNYSNGHLSSEYSYGDDGLYTLINGNPTHALYIHSTTSAGEQTAYFGVNGASLNVINTPTTSTPSIFVRNNVSYTDDDPYNPEQSSIILLATHQVAKDGKFYPPYEAYPERYFSIYFQEFDTSANLPIPNPITGPCGAVNICNYDVDQFIGEIGAQITLVKNKILINSTSEEATRNILFQSTFACLTLVYDSRKWWNIGTSPNGDFLIQPGVSALGNSWGPASGTVSVTSGGDFSVQSAEYNGGKGSINVRNSIKVFGPSLTLSAFGGGEDGYIYTTSGGYDAETAFAIPVLATSATSTDHLEKLNCSMFVTDKNPTILYIRVKGDDGNLRVGSIALST